MVILSCMQEVRSVDREIDPVFTSFGNMSPNCTDIKLTEWFELFHQYQDEGFDMFQADEKARKQIEIDLANCGHPGGRHAYKERSARK